MSFTMCSEDSLRFPTIPFISFDLLMHLDCTQITYKTAYNPNKHGIVDITVFFKCEYEAFYVRNKCARFPKIYAYVPSFRNCLVCFYRCHWALPIIFLAILSLCAYPGSSFIIRCTILCSCSNCTNSLAFFSTITLSGSCVFNAYSCQHLTAPSHNILIYKIAHFISSQFAEPHCLFVCLFVCEFIIFKIVPWFFTACGEFQFLIIFTISHIFHVLE